MALSFSSACVARTVVSHGKWVLVRYARWRHTLSHAQVQQTCTTIRNLLRAFLFEDDGRAGVPGPAICRWEPGARGSMQGPDAGVLLAAWTPLLFTAANGYMAESIVAARPWVPSP